MSLINEALKKAQQSRPHAGPDANRYAGGMAGGSSSMQRDFALFKWIFGIVLMSTVFVALLFMFLAFWQRPQFTEAAAPKEEEFPVTIRRPAPPAAVTAESPQVAEQPPPADSATPPTAAPTLLNLQPPDPAVVAPLPFEQQPAAPLPALTLPDIEIPATPATPTAITPPASTGDIPAADPVTATTGVGEPTPQPVAPTPAPAPVEPVPAPPPAQAVSVDNEAPPAPPPSDPVAIRSFLEESRISGIRMSGNDSRVLLNNRVHSVGSTVSHELGLSIEAIQPNEITFIDAAGTRYRKSFP